MRYARIMQFPNNPHHFYSDLQQFPLTPATPAQRRAPLSQISALTSVHDNANLSFVYRKL
jgi:hypothetical protein